MKCDDCDHYFSVAKGGCAHCGNTSQCACGDEDEDDCVDKEHKEVASKGAEDGARAEEKDLAEARSEECQEPVDVGDDAKERAEEDD